MKGRHLRVLAKQIVQRYPEKISGDFTANKNFVRTLDIMKSGEELNKLAGELCIMNGRVPKAIAA
jgi:ribosomal protein S17E